jgi:membrane-associated phospholipid phosphatase
MSDSPQTRPIALNPLRWLLVVLFVACLLLPLAHWIDADVVNALDSRATGIEGRDTYRLLRVLGSAYFWMLVFVVFVGEGFARRDDPERGMAIRDRAGLWSRGLFVLISAMGSGLLAEVVKLVVRRGRPDELLNRDATLSLTDPRTFDHVSMWPGTTMGNFWDAGDLGMASSHAATAFGGMLALGVMWPRWRWVLLVLAGLSAYTRLQSRDHYVSDLVGGVMCAAVVVGALVWTSRER